MQQETVVILDFGGQYTQLMARRIRELNVSCEILPCNCNTDEIKARKPGALVLSGGAASVYDRGAPTCDRRLLALGIPVLGICYGMQLMAYLLGGDVRREEHGGRGMTPIRLRPGSPLWHGLPTGEGEIRAVMSHGDTVVQPPAGFAIDAVSAGGAAVAISDRARRLYGLQFHPAAMHTGEGRSILRNYLYRVCGFKGTWTVEAFIEQTVARIAGQVGSSEGAILGLSGGVDSSVAALLVHRAIGDRLTCIFIDHGLLRQGEARQVVRTFKDRLKIRLVFVDAAREFLDRLQGVTDPESKRRVIGHHFIEVFEREAAKIAGAAYLVQGTIYPDVIESGTATAALIKSHHNVGGLPERFNLRLIEPLRQLFKDEVRRVGAALGLPPEILGRHPFPGPGLAVRVLGEVDDNKLRIVRAADAILHDEVRRAGLYDDIWQMFAVLPDIKSVGVTGGRRTYAHTIALRAVTGEDGMTADWYRFPHELLAQIAARIVSEVPGVNRVVYDITSKPPSTIEWE